MSATHNTSGSQMMANSQVSFFVFIGTKAQYIKTAPLMRLMEDRGIPYQLIDSGQHAAFAPGLRKELGVREPSATLVSKGNIRSVSELIIWFLRYVGLAVFRPAKLQRKLFQSQRGICIVHGDTPSTLLSLILAKRARQKVAHIEAGLRSFNIWRPFPEELVRVICMRFADYLFAPSEWAFANLHKMKIRGTCYNVGQNTNVEAMYYSLEQSQGAPYAARSYCLMTIHRVETILQKQRLEFIVSLAERLAKERKVIFVLHDPTKKQLEEYGWIERITENPNIDASALIPHKDFIALVADAAFVITDGGSIQEESYYLDVPCLVMRNETERQEGLGENVRLGKFDDATIEEFLTEYQFMSRGNRVGNLHPSEKILELLLDQARELAAKH